MKKNIIIIISAVFFVLALIFFIEHNANKELNWTSTKLTGQNSGKLKSDFLAEIEAIAWIPE